MFIRPLAISVFFIAGLLAGVAGMMMISDTEVGAVETAKPPVVTNEVPQSCSLRYDGMGLLAYAIYSDARKVFQNPSLWKPPVIDAAGPPEVAGPTIQELALAMAAADEGEADRDGRHIYNLVTRLPEDRVVRYLEQTLYISPDLLDDRLDLPSLAQRLYEMAMAREPHAYSNDSLRFGLELSSDDRLVDPRVVFEEKPVRVYATFDTEDAGYRKVLVKWMRVGDPTPIVFAAFKLRPTDTSHWIYYEFDEGWEEGVYQVEVFDPDDLSQAVTSGHYVVGNPEKLSN